MFGFPGAYRRQSFPDEIFVDLFPWSGPAVGRCDGRGVTLQALHGLSHAETVDLSRSIAVGAGLIAGDGGFFDATTSTYWRRRLAFSERPDRIFVGGLEGGGFRRGRSTGKTRRRRFHGARCSGGHAGRGYPADRASGVRREAVPDRGDRRAPRAHDYEFPGKPAISGRQAGPRRAGRCPDAPTAAGLIPPSRSSLRGPRRRRRCWSWSPARTFLLRVRISPTGGGAIFDPLAADRVDFHGRPR